MYALAHAPLLAGVERTLLSPLCARAVESRRALSLVRDRYAAGLVVALGAHRMASRPRRTFGPALRTWLFDRHVAAFVAANPRGTVVELGAGLSTRFERLDNGQLRWFDVDLPRVVALRERLLPRSPRRAHLAGSLGEPRWLAAIAGAPPYLFVLEAVLSYLTVAEVAAMLGGIAARCPGAELIFDLGRRDLEIAGSVPGRGRREPVYRHPRWREVGRLRALASAPIAAAADPTAGEAGYELIWMRAAARRRRSVFAATGR